MRVCMCKCTRIFYIIYIESCIPILAHTYRHTYLFARTHSSVTYT